MSIREDLKAYVDGELSQERAREVETAIELDAELRQEVEFMKSLSASLKAFRRDAPVKGQARAERQASGNRSRLPVWAYAAGSLILLAGIGMVGSRLLPSMGERAAGGAEMAPQARATAQPKEAAPADSDAVARNAPNPDMEMPRGPEKSKSEGGAGEAYFKTEQVPDAIASYPRRTLADEKAVSPTQDKGAAALANRDIIRRADIKVKVDSVSKRLAEATNLARTYGGYTESSNLSIDDPKRPTGSLVLRLPSRNFETALDKLRGMGEVLGENLDGDDVTAQVMDVVARLKTLRTEEEQYRTILRKAWRIGDILDVKQRLGDVRMEIEGLEAQQRFLKNETSFATIGVSLTQNYRDEAGAVGSSWTDETFAHAKVILGTAWQFIAQGAIYVLVLAPIWLPVILVFRWMQRRATSPSSSS